MNRSQKGESGILVFFLALVLIVLTGLAVYFWQNYEKEKALNALKTSISAADSPSKVVSQEETKPTLETKPSEPIADSKKEPVVIYTPNGLFNAAEITELKKKLINPFSDWNNDNSQNTVSISVEKPYPAIAGYRYKVTYINEGGGNGGFLYGTSTPLEWWLPECLGSCSFSAEFKAKYPEIVAKMAP